MLAVHALTDIEGERGKYLGAKYLFLSCTVYMLCSKIVVNGRKISWCKKLNSIQGELGDDHSKLEGVYSLV